MPLISFRTRASRANVLSSASRLGRPVTGPGARFAPLRNAALGRRFASEDAKQKESEDDAPLPTQSVHDIRLKSEFEANRDIREYLRKWQEITPNVLDPVRHQNGPDASWGTEVQNVAGQRWVGNMINYQSEAGGQDDPMKLTDEDMGDYAEIEGEGQGELDFLEPGDLVAFKYSEEVMRLAVYVRSIERQNQFYTSKGKWRIAHVVEVDFVVKGFTKPESVKPLHQWFPDSAAELKAEMQSVTEGGVPREAGAHLLRKMDAFDSQVHELYRVNSTRFDNIYDLVASDTTFKQMTLSELACEALEIGPESVNDVVRFTVHRAARQYPLLMEADWSNLFTDQYVVCPTPLATTLTTVTKWYHEHQDLVIRAMAKRGLMATSELRDHPMQKFIQKAQRLIRLSRKVRSPTTLASLGPSSQRFVPGQEKNPRVYRETPTEQFTEEDKHIIRFLQVYAIPSFNMTSSTMRSTGSHIMRSTGMYSALELSPYSAPLFMQELGVFTPWQNLTLFDAEMALPGHNLGGDEPWKKVVESCKHLPLTDKMAATRKDWGDMRVYCVDDPNAQEIDDGVSLERIPGSDDTFWIHSHVANPTAFIDHDHQTMTYAASRLSSLYVPETSYPMLPKPLTHNNFSLGPDRPTITFSAKMNLQGELLDSNISNGVIHNVKFLTHDRLRQVFGVEPEMSTPLVVGQTKKEKPKKEPPIKDTLTPQDEHTFHTLRQLMLGLYHQRVKNGAMFLPNSLDTPVSISAGDAPWEPSTMDVDTGRYFLGDPIIKLHPLKINPHEVRDNTKHDLIATLMNLACWVSARWLAKRNIPAVFDATLYHPEYPRLTKDNIHQFGGEGYKKIGAPRGISSSRPKPHTTMGFDSYVKSTSPLRRFTDLIAHYQIEAALRYEHEHGQTFDANQDTRKRTSLTFPPFTAEKIDNYITRSKWKHNRLRTITQKSRQFWACMLLFRAFYFGECELPSTFECSMRRQADVPTPIGTEPENHYVGVVTSMNVRAWIAAPMDMEVGIMDVVEAKITGVNLAKSLVTMQATKVVRKFERVGEWA